MVNTIYLFSSVETPRKFIMEGLSMRKLESKLIISTDENPSLRIESSEIINLRGFHKTKQVYLKVQPNLLTEDL